MADIFSKEKRSEIMSLIKGKNTKPELFVRSLLHRLGYRFRLNRTDLPGKPDIVLPRYRVAVFVHGCFWHRHEGCKYAYTPKSRPEFWAKKFQANIARDQRVREMLQSVGWRAITVWGCELRKSADLARRLDETLKSFSHQSSEL